MLGVSRTFLWRYSRLFFFYLRHFFSKDKGRPGVRSAESVKDAFMALLGSGKSGQYIHVDEYDTAVAQGEKKKKTFLTLQK